MTGAAEAQILERAVADFRQGRTGDVSARQQHLLTADVAQRRRHGLGHILLGHYVSS